MQNKKYHVCLTEQDFDFLIILTKEKIMKLEDDLDEAIDNSLCEPIIVDIVNDLRKYRSLYYKLVKVYDEFNNNNEA